MKVAVLLSGMLRNFEHTYPSFKKYIIDELNPDIFFSGFPNKNGIEYCKDKIENLWNPKRYEIREYNSEFRKKICRDEQKYLSNKRYETTPNTFISGVYNIKRCNDIKNQYQEENNVTYDFIIRVRPEVYFTKSISTDEIDFAKSGKVLIPNEWDFKSIHPMAVSDCIAISNKSSMDKYCKLYDHFDDYYEMGIMFHPETYFGLHINQQKLERHVVNRHGWICYEDPEGKNLHRKDF